MRTADRIDSAASEHAALAARLCAVEHACGDLLEQAEMVRAVLEVSREIAASREPESAISTLLRAMRQPLGFARGIYATVDRLNGVEARYEIDESDAVEVSFARLNVADGSALLRVLRGDGDQVGYAHDLNVPIVDVRGWYVLAALAGAEGSIAVLFADGHVTCEPSDALPRLVRSLTSVAAIAIENGTRYARSEELADRDPLTGLYNRRAFAERMRLLIDPTTAATRSFAYVLIDVDDFKRVNDRHGHARGDDVLRSIATTLIRHSRACDIAGRYAGDEFCLLLRDVDADVARILVARLSSDLRASEYSCSIGVAMFPRDATNERALVEAADRALYATKDAGKNGFSFY